MGQVDVNVIDNVSHIIVTYYSLWNMIINDVSQYWYQPLLYPDCPLLQLYYMYNIMIFYKVFCYYRQ